MTRRELYESINKLGPTDFYSSSEVTYIRGEEQVTSTTLEDYIPYYNIKRAKTKWNGLSPVDYRKQDTQ